MDEVVVTDQGLGEPVRQLGSKYFLAEPLGRGAMGVVHAATTHDNRPLAVKILRPELSTDDRTVARFVQERQIFSRIDHPNVVRVHDLVAEGDQLGIVMERVNGGDLKKRVEDRSLTPSTAMALAAEVAAGLQAIHAVDVVHRDLKPANILIAERSDGSIRPKISDFGISRLISEAMTRTSSTIGTPLYMAPEAADKRGAEGPADIYSLGAVMFEMLIGTAPFHEGGTFAVLKSHAMDAPPAIGGIPEQLALLIDHMLAKDPAVRPSAAEVQQRIEAILPEIDDTVSPIAIERVMPAAAVAAPAVADGVADADADESGPRFAETITTEPAAAAAGVAAAASNPSDSSETVVMAVAESLPSDSSETIADFALPAAAAAGFAAAGAEVADGAVADGSIADATVVEQGLFGDPQQSDDLVPAPPSPAPPGAAPPNPGQLAGVGAGVLAGGAPPHAPGAPTPSAGAPLSPTTTGASGSFMAGQRPRRLAGIGLAVASIAAVAGIGFFALQRGDDASGSGDGTAIDAGTGDDGTTASTNESDGSEGSGDRDGEGGQGTLTPTSTSDDSSDNGSDGSTEPTTATTAGSGTTEAPANTTTTSGGASTTATTADGGTTTPTIATTTTTAETTTTTKATTTTTSTTVTEPSVTIGPVGTPVIIISGPTINSVGQGSFHFNYTTNDVCGTGSFSVYKATGGALIGSYSGDNVCFGPLHGGFPQASHPTFGGFNLEPATTYRVVVTVTGTASDGVRTRGTGSDSRSFMVTTDA